MRVFCVNLCGKIWAKNGNVAGCVLEWLHVFSVFALCIKCLVYLIVCILQARIVCVYVLLTVLGFICIPRGPTTTSDEIYRDRIKGLAFWLLYLYPPTNLYVCVSRQ